MIRPRTKLLKKSQHGKCSSLWMAAKNVSGAQSALSVLSREYYYSVMMCFHSVSLIPKGKEPHSQLCCLLVHFTRNASTYTAHRHADTNKYTQAHRNTHIRQHSGSVVSSIASKQEGFEPWPYQVLSV